MHINYILLRITTTLCALANNATVYCCSAFSPVSGFMSEAEYTSVVENMALPDGTTFGLPIVFDTADDSIVTGDKLLLTYKGQNIGTLAVDEKYTPNKAVECMKCYGTASIDHPAVQMVAMERGKFYLSGKVCAFCCTEWRALHGEFSALF